jgi:hypothetical protein
MQRISTYTKKQQFNGTSKAYVSEWSDDGVLLSFVMSSGHGTVKCESDFTEILNDGIRESEVEDYVETLGLDGFDKTSALLRYSMDYRAMKRAYNIHIRKMRVEIGRTWENEAWFADAINIYEVNEMISERLNNKDKIPAEDIPTLKTVRDDVKNIIDLETNQIENVLYEEDIEEIRACKKTIKDCNRWLTKYSKKD